MKKSKGEAFTLIELMVVTVMLSIVCLAIYSTFASGARIWQRVNRMPVNEDVNIFFDRFSSDVKNSVDFTGVRFSGTADRVELPTLVSSPALESRTVGIAVYSCAGSTLVRGQADYSQIYQDASITPRHVLGGLQACAFTYYQYDDERQEYVWVDEWTKTGFPLAVRLELTLGPGSSGAAFVKTVSVPIAGKDKDE